MATESAVQPEAPGEKARLVYPSLTIPFILLVLCFAAWGSAANLTDVLVGVFRSIFDMSNVQSALVQFAYYGAYFSLAIPAALINRRFGYKTGVLAGLGLAAVGGMLFIPASDSLTFGYFLVALFVLAAGLSILETSANPFVIAMGPEASATQRLNLAQSFNPVGANIGVLLGAVLILPQITSEASKTIMSPAELRQSQEDDLSLVLGPYLGIAIVLIVIWVSILLRKMSTPVEESAEGEVRRGAFGRLWRNRHYRYGVIAQFFNVAAQVCVWTFTIQYAQDVVGIPTEDSGWYLQASLIVFLVARFVMTYLLGIFRPTKLLFLMGALGVGLCLVAVFSQDMAGLIAVVAVSLSLSLMFPTIYGVALQGLREDAKFGAAGLVMAILGGALLPLLQGLVMDDYGTAMGFIVPAVCLAIVTAYALFDLRTNREGGALVAEGAHSMRASRGAAAAGALLLALLVAACGGSDPKRVTVGRTIIKQETNPFFVKIRETAEDAADDDNINLLTAAGKSDVDNASQVAALASMTARGAKGIMITPADSTAVVPAIEKARRAGVTVVALDTPTNPLSAVDEVFATNNRTAGTLIGRYAKAKAAEDGLDPKIAMLDLAPGITSGLLRHNGFLAGFGIRNDDPRIVGRADTEGNKVKAQAAMTRLLRATPDINVVYTVNEPAAFGAWNALKAAGKDKDDVVLVSVDGGCDAIKDGVRPKVIDATSQQYPENMATEGLEAVARTARGGPKPSGFSDTGVELITAQEVEGVDSRDEAFGVRNCWGD